MTYYELTQITLIVLLKGLYLNLQAQKKRFAQRVSWHFIGLLEVTIYFITVFKLTLICLIDYLGYLKLKANHPLPYKDPYP